MHWKPLSYLRVNHTFSNIYQLWLNIKLFPTLYCGTFERIFNLWFLLQKDTLICPLCNYWIILQKNLISLFKGHHLFPQQVYLLDAFYITERAVRKQMNSRMFKKDKVTEWHMLGLLFTRHHLNKVINLE